MRVKEPPLCCSLHTSYVCPDCGYRLCSPCINVFNSDDNLWKMHDFKSTLICPGCNKPVFWKSVE